jgi:hypothetical protein
MRRLGRAVDRGDHAIVGFSTLNSVGFWLTATEALLINLSLVVGEFDSTS